MQLTLCNFSKRLNSTKQPTSEQLAAGKTFTDVNLKQLVNIDNPDLVLAGAKQNDFAYNYAYIHDWGRYYHIKTCDLRHEDIYHAKLELDDLATFKAQILGTDAYIVYSSTGFNRWIKDDRCPLLIKGTEAIEVHSQIKYGEGESALVFEASATDEIIIIYAIAEGAGLVHYVIRENELPELTAGLCQSGIQSFLDNLQKQFGDAVGSIIQVRRMPLNGSAPEYLPGVVNFKIGSYEVTDADDEPIPCRALASTFITANGETSIPVTYTDYRFTEPYCTMKISLPFIGVVEASIADFAPDGVIYWNMMLDIITGSIIFTLFNNSSRTKAVASFSGECGMLIPIASRQIGNASSIVSSAFSSSLGIAASAIAMNPGPAVLGGITAIASSFFGLSQKTSSVIGSYAGNRSEFINRAFRVIVLKHPTANEPANLTDFEGRPVCKVDTIGNYSGYVKTQGFSIDIAANSDVIKSINSKLDSGIYIE